jgi:lysophospholipid acyltransferase (LPLAT)-like uncharacterized protein
MRPVHTAFRLMGLKPLLLGSSGEEGRRAANDLARLVQKGWSTTISPDGPYGPPRLLKKGVLHVALKSGVPIVPLTIVALRRVAYAGQAGRQAISATVQPYPCHRSPAHRRELA